MINLVYWKDVVGKKFLEEFVKATKGIILARKNDQPESVVLNKLSLEGQDKYRMKRNQMRKCGYEGKKDTSNILWHGWYSSYIENGELRFLCTVPKEERKYIALPTFLEWKKMGNIEDDIDQYYRDKDFPPEENT